MYFTYDRKRWAIEDIAKCYECAERAGIKDKLFVNFGVLLGAVREGDFIGGDDDVDLAVNSDDITLDQQLAYIDYLDKAGMFFAREKHFRRPDNKKYLWFTLRKRQGRAKFCHWWGFNWENFWWWSKGSGWVRQSKFDSRRWEYGSETEGIALGLPSKLMEKLMWIKFKGIKMQVPEKYGSVLDWEYPAWPVPQSGSSRKQVVCVIEKWNNTRTWKIYTPPVLL